MKTWKLLPMLSVLAACGVDGEPIPPGPEDDETVSQEVIAPKTDISTTTVLSAGSSGVNAGVATTLSRGNFSLTLGRGF